MKRIVLLLFIFSSTILSQPKITAKHNKDLADSLACTYAADASLALVTSSEVDSNGLSGQ
jgi:hypothetical protein